MRGRLKTYFSSFWQCGCLPLAAYGKDRCLFDKHSLLGFGQAFNGDIFIHSFNGYYSLKINVFFRFIVSITYTGRMEAGEFTAFPFIALNPKGDVSVKYKAYITYEDGVVVPFDGSEEAKGYQPTIHLR